MPLRWKVFLRLIGAIVFATAGYGAGSVLFPEFVQQSSQLPASSAFSQLFLNRFLISLSFALFGFAFGYLLTPALLRPLDAMYDDLRDIPPVKIVGATVGLGIGLGLGALLALPLSLLPTPFGQFLPFLVASVMGYLGAVIVFGNPQAYLGFLRGMPGMRGAGGMPSSDKILLDTSVIIDGRIADVADTGFLTQRLIVPRFVLDELQQVADSADSLRRNRGRRGLEVLNRIQQSPLAHVEITDTDMPGADDVDRKLVRFAEEQKCPLMTNDFNLKRVAEIQGIRVLNLNELANAVKTVLLPGEQLEIEIIQEGKEPEQGVGYLEDGTMVVVEHGRSRLSQRVPVTVTRVLQTSAGRMIFAAAVDGRS